MRQRVKFIGLQYNFDHTKYIPLVNILKRWYFPKFLGLYIKLDLLRRAGSTVTFKPHKHKIVNVDHYNDCVFSEAMLQNPNKDLFKEYPGSWEVAL